MARAIRSSSRYCPTFIRPSGPLLVSGFLWAGILSPALTVGLAASLNCGFNCVLYASAVLKVGVMEFFCRRRGGQRSWWLAAGL
ncbi:hypothetical protein Maes01_01891 [Microbulbifer aestuariivivens]|uniref:Uncharacterized protein n=1 Tax=Microbulbifer aestuariivivens TaxID=1908308 RepID=A0ABP9WT94_9GAMM